MVVHLRLFALCHLSLILIMALGSNLSAAETLPAADQLPARPELPDPLAMMDGTPVRTAKDWREKRVPELKRLFQHYMYGFLPAAPEKVSAKVLFEDKSAFDGTATLREVQLTFGPKGTPPIHLLLAVPNDRQRPAGVFLGLNFCGNHTVLADKRIALPSVWMPERCPGVKDNRATDAGRGAKIDTWCLENTLKRGWAVATFYHGEVDPDRHDWTDGVHPHYYKKGQTEPGPHDWGSIAAWAWGLHRAVDYLVEQPDVDTKRIVVMGHSRNGKTALVAGAFDERIALVIPHQAGCGGTSPSRGKIGESVKRINDSLPHWFCDEFTRFNDAPEKLPFDQHCLIALCAPRPVLLTNAQDDQWSNPSGQFEMLQAAEPVYKLLEAGGLDAQQMPPHNQLVASRLGYYIRPGKHSMTQGDWDVFIEYAEKQLGKGK